MIFVGAKQLGKSSQAKIYINPAASLLHEIPNKLGGLIADHAKTMLSC